ncbi:hypothetical protein [Rhizorhabdus argentea]|uniref:hypothetical protein n=1 Tax=Rhizorhabdus argentea TaxID=1387174 RepID=UPI0030EFA53A
MEDQPPNLGDHPEADRLQNQSARPGAQAKGGIASQPGDPTNPRAAAQRAKGRNFRAKAAGSGNDKGTDMGRDGNG